MVLAFQKKNWQVFSDVHCSKSTTYFETTDSFLCLVFIVYPFRSCGFYTGLENNCNFFIVES